MYKFVALYCNIFCIVTCIVKCISINYFYDNESKSCVFCFQETNSKAEWGIARFDDLVNWGLKVSAKT